MRSHIGKCDLLICVNVCFAYLYCLGCLSAVVTPPCPGRTPVCRCCRTSDTLCAYLLIITSYHAYNISRISYQRYNHYTPHNWHNHNVHIYISVVYALVCVFVVFIYGAGSFCLLLWHLLTLGGPMFSRCCHISEIVTYLSVRMFVLLIFIVWSVYLLLWHLLALEGLMFADAVAHLMLYAYICLL